MKNICVHKGLPFGRQLLRAQPVRATSASSRKTLPRRELPRLPLRLRQHGQAGAGPYDPAGREGVDDPDRARWTEERRRRRQRTSTPSSACTWRFAHARPRAARPTPWASWVHMYTADSRQRPLAALDPSSGTARPQDQILRATPDLPDRRRAAARSTATPKMTPEATRADLRTECGQTLWHRRRPASFSQRARRDEIERRRGLHTGKTRTRIFLPSGPRPSARFSQI